MKITKTIFLIAAGVAAGILLAPHSGAKTRKKLRKRAAGLLGKVGDKVDETNDKIQSGLESAQEKLG